MAVSYTHLKWTKKWRIRLNEMKSVNVNFTNLKIGHRIPFIINSLRIPYANTAKYLGMTLDAKLKWKEHVKKKKQELNLKFWKMYWLLGRQSQLSIHNKLLLYKQVLKPIWTYGIQPVSYTHLLSENVCVCGESVTISSHICYRYTLLIALPMT